MRLTFLFHSEITQPAELTSVKVTKDSRFAIISQMSNVRLVLPDDDFWILIIFSLLGNLVSRLAGRDRCPALRRPPPHAIRVGELLRRSSPELRLERERRFVCLLCSFLSA